LEVLSKRWCVWERVNLPELMDLFFKVIPKSLLWGIGDSRQEILSPAGLSLRNVQFSDTLKYFL